MKPYRSEFDPADRSKVFLTAMLVLEDAYRLAGVEPDGGALGAAAEAVASDIWRRFDEAAIEGAHDGAGPLQVDWRPVFRDAGLLALAAVHNREVAQLGALNADLAKLQRDLFEK